MTTEEDDGITMTDNPVAIAASAIAAAAGATMLFAYAMAVVGCILVTLCPSQMELLVMLGTAVAGAWMIV